MRQADRPRRLFCCTSAHVKALALHAGLSSTWLGRRQLLAYGARSFHSVTAHVNLNSSYLTSIVALRVHRLQGQASSSYVPLQASQSF